ncbi:ABC-type sugar transport systems permease component-like protein [Kribbella flavida DSM 17836]|uniref:ABC-type sugar transport systems permease component-like protein n=1 Tax=Kribbella flavida (strain DSM 17836 / JCM 10339 / NBRC 14399) TaxID=479435 RepID=D2PX38_KRIFD|nr:ABC transporter permease subunit [Kribbella flavida]ADB35418.1 ABC-type sugar transport systems permease component-like protein [Kribbella flavida DSM 17836]
MGLRSNGLSLEIAGRPIVGRPVPGKPRRPAGPYLLGLPALLLSSLLLIPVALTVVAAFRLPDGSFGLDNFAVMGDPAALHAVRNSLAWVAVALALVVVGFLLAVVSYRLPALSSFLQPALVIPFAVSVLASGATFRLIFDPAPERGTVTAVWTSLFGSSPVWLGPGLFWLVLVSAFGWTWLGYVVSLFRAGLDAIPDDVSRTIAAEGVTGWRRWRVLELPLLRPITGVVTLTLVIAAVRVFDLVLIVVPGPMQRDAEVLGLNWWRATSAGDDPGRTAALGVVLFAIVAAVAVIGVRGLRRRRWAMPATVVPADPSLRRPKPSKRVRRIGWTAGFAVSLFWILPAVMLVATALHSPGEAGLRGWWSLRGLGFESFTAAANVGLMRALLSTVLISSIATGVLLVIAVPTAYLVAWGGLPTWLGRVVTSGFVVLAVTPVQMYAAPLREAIDAAGLTGSRIALALVHAAAGLPFAVLLLRSAFASAPPVLVAEALQGPARQRAVLATVQRTYRPALVAVAVLEFVLVWNDFIVGFLISGAGTTPLSLVLWGEARQFSTSGGTVAAAALVASVVPAVLMLSFWRTVVRGLTVGGRP